MARIASVFAVALIAAQSFGFTGAVSAEEFSLETAPPVVVKTLPASGVGNVSPALKEIKVQFSKGMATNTMSWLASPAKGTSPGLAGTPHYEQDNRTCVMPVKLEAGKSYAIWINTDEVDSEQYNNFKDLAGRRAVPYLLVFRTSDKSEAAKAGKYQPSGTSGKDVETGSLETPAFDNFQKNVPPTITSPLESPAK